MAGFQETVLDRMRIGNRSSAVSTVWPGFTAGLCSQIFGCKLNRKTSTV